MSNPGVQGSFARPHAAGISGGDQGWIGEGLRGDARLRGQKRGGASGEFVRSFLPESRPQRAGPAPAVPAPTGPPPLAPGAGLGLPRAPPPRWPAPARPHALLAATAWVSMGMGVRDCRAAPLGGARPGGLAEPRPKPWGSGCGPWSCCCPDLRT